MKPAKRTQNVSEYYFAKKLREINDLNAQGKEIIHLGIGSPDLPPHPLVLSSLREASSQEGSHAYQPYSGISELRNAFRQWYLERYRVRLDPETEILPLLGSKEGIMHVSMTFCNPGDRVLIPNPGYPAYSSVSKLLDLDVKQYTLSEENHWMPDINELKILMNEKCKLIWINTVHMPSGALMSKSILKELIALADSKNILVVNDNPYSLILNDSPYSILDFVSGFNGLLELNSLSKSHNMPGWRVGMLAGSKENIRNVLKIKSNVDSGMFKPVQLAAIKALGLSQEWYNSLNALYAERRRIVWEMLRVLECSFSENSVGLFVWARIPKNFSDASSFSDFLLYELGIFASPGFVFGSNGNRYIRFSLCAPKASLDKALSRIVRFKRNEVCALQ